MARITKMELGKNFHTNLKTVLTFFKLISIDTIGLFSS